MAKQKNEGGAAVAEPKTNILDADKAAEVQRAKPVNAYTVEINGEAHTAQGQTWNEAWANVCDKRRKWPSIKHCGARVTDSEGKQVYPAAA